MKIWIYSWLALDKDILKREIYTMGWEFRNEVYILLAIISKRWHNRGDDCRKETQGVSGLGTKYFEAYIWKKQEEILRMYEIATIIVE